MGVKAALARLAAGAPARCFAVVGAEADEIAPWLRLDPELVIVDSPRAADVLLVLGRLDDEMLRAAAGVHDAMPPPRGVVSWSPGGMRPASWPPGGERPVSWPFTDDVRVDDRAQIPAACRRLRDELLSGRRASSPDILPDIDPAPWRGVGPFGQGGAGMTGGVPYGRPLAARADDRDGLKLDQILVRVGPYLPPFPSGLVLDVKIQGDVIQEVSIPTPAAVAPDLMSAGAHSAGAHSLTGERALFNAALTQPVPVTDIEVARARHHLVWLAEALRVSGLEAYGRRVLKLARTVRPEAAEPVDDLSRWLRRNVSLRWGTRGVGMVSASRAAALPGGPVARASGVGRDARGLDPVYGRLGFTPVVLEVGDALARWRVRIDEAQQALALAQRAGESLTTPIGLVEGPCGPIGGERSTSAALVTMLLELLVGMEWGNAVTTVVSLDIDMAEAALPHDAAVASRAS
ncbi:MAG TPA: hypothetical protein VIL79_03205 [Thermoleophilia bacterium]